MNDLFDDVLCGIAIYADDTTLYFKCDQASDLWQQIELASEHCGLGRKWLVNFNTGKIQVVCLRGSNNTGAIDVKMDEHVHEKKFIFLDAWVNFFF